MNGKAISGDFNGATPFREAIKMCLFSDRPVAEAIE
jgi:hypothetical protein